MSNVRVNSVVFLSNYFNHHQSPFSDAMFERLGSGYTFIETEPMSEERIAMGWGQGTKPGYVVSGDDFSRRRELYLSQIENADIVVIGSAPAALLQERMRKDKLIFRYSERPLKNGDETWKYPVRLFTWRRQHPQSGNIRLLCASAYTSADYAKFGLYRKKAYQWGYFPACKRYDPVGELLGSKDRRQILWCGRFLDWKHPDDAVEIAGRLLNEGYDFRLHMIGTGEMEETLRRMIRDRGLERHVTILGPMSPEKVREHMERAGIFLFTSDRREGWGAVLNESMNSGCAVAASHAIGSAPYLLKNGENGFVYGSGQIEELYDRVKYLLDHPEEQARLGEAAYRMIAGEWNAETAAERLIRLSERLLNGEKAPELYASGPCSKAEVIKNNWYLTAKRNV